MANQRTIDKTKKELGKRVRFFRTKKGWSQETLGFEAGLHTNYIGGIERGERDPSVSALTQIAGALGVSVKDLFG